MIRFKRALRTASSERFVAVRGARMVGTVDLHHQEGGRVSGTVVLDESAGWTEEAIADFMATLNEDLAGHASASRGTLHLMVVVGEVIGQAEQNGAEEPAAGKKMRR